MADPHNCPFTAGQLLALYAIVAIRGEHPTLARLLLEHAQQHAAQTTPQEEP